MPSSLFIDNISLFLFILFSSLFLPLPLQGYDMEDAMIINKASLERGFGHASIHKTEQINLKTKLGESQI